MITTVLFDLDGTLLPMDQDLFIKTYLSRMAKKMAPHGYDPDLLVSGIWKGSAAMIRNDGSMTNEDVFWSTFNAVAGRNCRADEQLFIDFYSNEFQDVKTVCGFEPKSAQVIAELRARGIRVALATNPLFPAIATHSRIRWAGLDPEDFELITTYENSSHSKPNPDYFREILAKLDVTAENCLMVGNDVDDDMAAAEIGMDVFLLTDSLINHHNKNIEIYPHGGIDQLIAYVREL